MTGSGTPSPDLAPLTALAVTDEDRSASGLKVSFGQRKCFVDPKPGAPQDDDEGTDPVTVNAGAGRTHDGDDFLHPWWISGIAPALVPWAASAAIARLSGRRASATGRVKQVNRHEPS